MYLTAEVASKNEAAVLSYLHTRTNTTVNFKNHALIFTQESDVTLMIHAYVLSVSWDFLHVTENIVADANFHKAPTLNTSLK